MALGQVIDLVGELTQRAGIMVCNDYGCPSSLLPANNVLDRLDARGVEGVGGFIESDEPWVFHDGGGNTESLLHAQRVCAIGASVEWVEAYVSNGLLACIAVNLALHRRKHDEVFDSGLMRKKCGTF